MPSSPCRSAILLAALTLGGCSQVSVDAYPRQPGTVEACDVLLADVVPQVDGQARRIVDDGLAAAWGDPEIVLRCGDTDMDAADGRMRRIDGAVWLVSEAEYSVTARSTGTFPPVSVQVPQQYDLTAVVSDLEPTLLKHTTPTPAPGRPD